LQRRWAALRQSTHRRRESTAEGSAKDYSSFHFISA
jgi:hypothetical protein